MVDCSKEILNHMRRFSDSEEIVYGFDEDAPYNQPSLDALMPKVMDWLKSAEALDLGAFYTPEELEPELASDQPAQVPKGPGNRRPSNTGGGVKPKRPTTASLAAEVKEFATYLPQISEQLSRLAQRQDLMETQLATRGSSASAVASRPLGATMGQLPAPALADLARTVGRPPKTQGQPNLGLLAGLQASGMPEELQELTAEKPGLEATSYPSGDSALAMAIMEQSKALTSLVSQMAASHSDPMMDLSGSSSTSTRGAAGRAKLQAELALQKGTFFMAVLHQMARRMAPTSSVEQSPAALMARGISGLRYLERFGGYSRQRELGQLQYQVMTAFDFLMEDNVPAAKDAIALLAVSIEQGCMDGGKMDLATLLCLQEDPPAAIFQNRQLAATSRARSFAPLADQRWITCALAFLKEMEVIQAKRLELTGAPKGPAAVEPSGDGAKVKPKGNPKKKGKGKGQQAEDADQAS